MTCSLALILLAVAFGIFSSTLFVWEWILGAPTQLSASILFLVTTVVCLKVFLYLRRRVPRIPFRPGRAWLFRVLPVACVGIAVVSAAFSVVQQLESVPNGGFDAFAVWNLHARFLYRGSSGAWRDMFLPAMAGSNPDYPLLLPGLVSGAWMITGTDLPLIPALLGIAFAALSIGIVGSAVSAIAGDERGWLVALLVLATPSFLSWAPLQVADIPIGLYMLATVVLLQFADAWPEVRRPMMVLAGLTAGFAAWTKNEGLLFIIAVLAGYLTSFAHAGAWRRIRKSAPGCAETGHRPVSVPSRRVRGSRTRRSI